MKHIIFLSSFFLFGMLAFSQETEDAFEQFRQQSQAGFDQFREETNKQWEAYEKANKEAFEQFKKGIEQKWGAGNFVESTQTSWVEYSEDGESRTSVDFEQEEARVEILMTPEEANNAGLVKQKIAEAVKELALNKGKTKDYETEYEKPEPLMDEPVLKDQLQNAAGETVTEENLDEYAEQIVEQQPIEKEVVKPKPPEPQPEPEPQPKPDPKPQEEKVIVSVKIPLATNSIQNQSAAILRGSDKLLMQIGLVLTQLWCLPLLSTQELL